MGTSNSKQQLINDEVCNLNIGGCGVYKCVNDVEGKPSSSASPTDIWFITFGNDKDVNYNGIDVGTKRAVMKIFTVSPPKISILNNGTYENSIKSFAIDYEYNIYKDFVRPTIELGICTNFVQFIGGGLECSFDNLLQVLLNGKLKTIPANASEEDIAYTLIRNIAFMVGVWNPKNATRPAINNIVYKDVAEMQIEGGEETIKELIGAKFGFLITELMDPLRNITFLDWLKTDIPRETTRFPYEGWAIMFQVAIACYAMSLANITHNDLHPGNILLERSRIPTRVTYAVDGIFYTFYTTYKARIYDFDRSYSRKRGDNPLLDYTCKQNNQCNRFIPNLDIVKIFGYIAPVESGGGGGGKWRPPLSKQRGDMNNLLLQILSNESTTDTELLNVWRNTNFLIDPGTDLPAVDKFFTNKINEMDEIVKIIGTLVSVGTVRSDLDKNVWGVCNKSDFDSKGFFKASSVKFPTFSLENQPDLARSLDRYIISETDIIPDAVKDDVYRSRKYGAPEPTRLPQKPQSLVQMRGQLFPGPTPTPTPTPPTQKQFVARSSEFERSRPKQQISSFASGPAPQKQFVARSSEFERSRPKQQISSFAASSPSPTF